MDNAALHEIVMKLIGPVMPVGETHTDDKRFENLEKLLKLMESLTEEVTPIARKTGAVEFSIQRAADMTAHFLHHACFRDQTGNAWQVLTLLDCEDAEDHIGEDVRYGMSIAELQTVGITRNRKLVGIGDDGFKIGPGETLFPYIAVRRKQ